MLEFYGDVIVMRHFQQGAPHEAAKWASIPIINGGDGWGEHPTQILTDLYTVMREKGRIDGLKWLAVGDMRMRTMHSLGYAMSQFDCPITFVSPPDMSLTDEFKTDLKQYSVNFREVEHVEQAIADADVILVEPVVQPDYTKSRDDRGSSWRPRPSQTPSCSTPCPAWTRSRPMWTSPAGHATGRKPSTAWSCA
jgi:aspartate carbamoyltransferase catalytic subunit